MPINYLKYTLFGSESDPDIFIEDFVKDMEDDYNNQSTIKDSPAIKDYSEPDTLRKELNIELANLTDEEIKEFLRSI